MASNLDFAEDIEAAKAYMAEKNVFQLFESLLTAVVHNRPDDPVVFLQKCLETVGQNGDIRWDSFLHVSEKSRSKSSQTAEPGQFADKVFETEVDTER